MCSIRTSRKPLSDSEYGESVARVNAIPKTRINLPAYGDVAHASGRDPPSPSHDTAAAPRRPVDSNAAAPRQPPAP
jgi:hypothetical protein